MNKVSTDNADTPSVLHSSRRRSTSRRHIPTTSLVDTLDSKHKVSNANADTSSAVVKPAKGIDESATVVVGYGMVPLMKFSHAKLGSFEPGVDRQR